MEYRKINGIKHYVYDNIQEFESHNSSDDKEIVKDWRESEEGDWVLSDDSRIIQILKKAPINHPQNRKNYKYVTHYCRTVVGSFLCHKKVFMDTSFENHPNRYTFSKADTSEINKRIHTRKSPTKKEKIFATNIAVGMGAVKSYMDAFSEGDSYKAEKKAAILLKQERVMKEVEKSVLAVAKDMGIDHEYVLTRLKCIVENAERDETVLNAVKELGKAIGTLGTTTIKQKEQGIIGLFSGFQPDQIEQAARSESPLLPSSSDIEEEEEKQKIEEETDNA